MKKLFGILGTAAGAGLLGLGIFNLVKKNNDVDVDECEFDGYGEETEVDDEDESEEE